MVEEQEISPKQLETFRRCTFARRVFAPRSSLWAKRPLGYGDLPADSRDGNEVWYASKAYGGETVDTEEYEMRMDDWDHEHCDVCGFKVVDGTAYWPNIDPDAGQVDLCEACYPRVIRLLGNLQSPND
jgi:hypothetical protein